MTHPTVVAVCLTADRPEFTRHAVECFRRQSYENKKLVIWDTSKTLGAMDWYASTGSGYHGDSEDPREKFVADYPGITVGELRNDANASAVKFGADIIITLDSDDHSHELRIAEQVALLQSSRAECVGYNELLFWREPTAEIRETEHMDTCTCGTCGPGKRTVISGFHSLGEAWLYSGGTPALGTSLAYWRETWERRPFPSLNVGEDASWLTGVNVVGVNSLITPESPCAHGRIGCDCANAMADRARNRQPRMVARIHGGNTSRSYDPGVMAACERQGDVWNRVSAWDSYCKGVFAK